MSRSKRRPSVLARMPRRPLVLGGGLAMLGIIALGPAAAAEVNLSPAEAEQGGAAGVTLEVHNDRPGVFTTKVEVQFPQETPIAEIYPMSVANWAPISTSREIDQPLEGVHSSGLTTVTSAITWIRAEGAPKAPEVEKLNLQLGPLPQIDDLVLTVVQTYSDGKTQRWSGPTVASAGVAAGPGTVLHLVPSAAVAATPTADEAEEEVVAPAAGDGRTGTQLGLIGAGIVAGVLISALAVVTIGSKARSRAEQPKDSTSEEKADVVA